jgi:ubiquinone/menaquinone biosynthesis C-methylase UbiE
MSVKNGNLLGKIYCYIKIAVYYLKGLKIKPKDYAKDYDLVSQNYDQLWIKEMGRYTQAMLSKIDYFQGYSLLDLACGTGFIIEESLKRAEPTQIVGIDNSSKMLARLREKIKSKKVKLICEDVNQAIEKIPNQSFDIITCGWGLLYLDKKAFLKNVKRILKPGGTLAVIVNRKGTLLNVEKAFLKLMEQNPDKIKLVNDISYKLPRNFNSLKKLFNKFGFKWVTGFDRKKSFSFKNGKEAVNWVTKCGALAGTFQLLELKDFTQGLAQVLEKNYFKNNRIKVTHKFSVAIGKKIR